MKVVKDGWHVICGEDVYVENGCVVRGMRDGRTTYPYRADGKGEWDLDQGTSVFGFRAAYGRDTMRMM